MTDNPHLRDILDRASELSPHDRPAFLDSACTNDPELRAQVEALLHALDNAPDLLRDPTFDHDLPTADARRPHHAESTGSRIGRYKLLQLIGEGGFGSVFMAEQETPVIRKVALKIIKLGMDTRQVIARFEAERQALAMMDHPNIAKVLDAGSTDTGRPYFVMELVKGDPITTFCDANRLTTPQRLELFVQVCSAVQHAHQKGIIHRDLKPSNVLVTMHDDKPVPKIIDFGVAKALNQRLTTHTLFTEFRQMIGTPVYMSPEQAQMSGLDVDTRSDVYSLGVLLYELLTGATPFDPQTLRNASHEEMRRIIREVDPPKASTRLSTLAAGTQTAVADHRRCDPATLGRMLQGDLDWILMKCLEKDRARRYETASALARDIQRHLADEPVEASPPSTTYRLRKLARKHKREAVAITVIFATLLLGITGTTLGLARAQINLKAARAAELQARSDKSLATVARERESSQRKQAEAVAGILDSIFHRLDPFSEPTALPDLKSQLIEDLKKLADSPDKDAAGDPLVRARLHDSLGWTLLQLGEIRKAESLLQSAVEQWKSAGGPEDALKHRMLYHFAVAQERSGHTLAAIKLLEEVQTWQKSTIGADDRDALTTSFALAEAYRDGGRFTDAVRLFAQVRDRQSAKFSPDDPDTLRTLQAIAQTIRESGRTREAIDLLREIHKRQLKILHGDHPDVLRTQVKLAEAYIDNGKGVDAVTLLTQIRDQQTQKLTPDHPDVLLTLNQLAEAFYSVGKVNDGIALLEQSRDASIRKLGPEHPQTDATTSSLLNMYFSAGQTSKAIQLAESVRDQRQQPNVDKEARLRSVALLARTYATGGRYYEAIRMYEGVRAERIETLGSDHPDVLSVSQSLGYLYADVSRFTDAIRLDEEVLEKRRQTLGPENSSVLGSMAALAYALDRSGQGLGAVSLLEKVEDVAKNAGNIKTWRNIRIDLGLNYARIGRQQEGIRILEEMRDEYIRSLGPSDPSTLHAMSSLVLAYSVAERNEDALSLEEQLQPLAARVFGPYHPNTLTETKTLLHLRDYFGHRSDAEKLVRTVREGLLREVGPDDPRTIEMTTYLYGQCEVNDRIAEALILAESNRVIALRSLGVDDPLTIEITEDLINIYKQMRRKADAEKLTRELLPHLARVEAKELSYKLQDNPADSDALLGRGWLYKKTGEPDKSALDFGKAIESATHRIPGDGDPKEKAKAIAKRATFFARLGKFDDALADFLKAVELDPENHLYWHDGVLPFLLQTGDLDRYRRWRRKELRRFQNTSDPVAAHRVAKDAFMMPLEGEELAIAFSLAERGRDIDSKSDAKGAQTKGMAEYRAGRFEEAIPWLAKSEVNAVFYTSRLPGELFRAMALERAGNHTQARMTLDHADRLLTVFPEPGEDDLIVANPISDWILCQVVRREAEQLINGSNPTTRPAPSTQPVAAN